MQSLWDSGLWLDVAIAITVLELAVLGGACLLTRHGPSPSAWALNLLSGLMLTLALRSSLSGGAWHWPVLCLAISGLLHGADLWWRWRVHQRVKPS